MNTLVYIFLKGSIIECLLIEFTFSKMVVLLQPEIEPFVYFERIADEHSAGRKDTV